MTPKHVIHLLSGGLDSVVMLYDLQSQGCKIHCALFDYKQRHVQELVWAKNHCQRLSINFTLIEIPQLRGSEITDGDGGVVVEGRNAIFISHAIHLAASAGAECVTIAANEDDSEVFPDCRSGFVEAYNNLLHASEIKVELCAPYLKRSKAWIASKGSNLGVRFSETWSCYRGGIQPCGRCGACIKRNEALKG